MLNNLSRKNLLLLAKGLYFVGIEDLTKETIIGFIYEIYDIHKLPAKVGPPFYIFVNDSDVIVFQFNNNSVKHEFQIPVLDVHNYDKVNFVNESIIIKKGKKSYIINDIITV
jgi:hypothetical protein